MIFSKHWLKERKVWVMNVKVGASVRIILNYAKNIPMIFSLPNYVSINFLNNLMQPNRCLMYFNRFQILKYMILVKFWLNRYKHHFIVVFWEELHWVLLNCKIQILMFLLVIGFTVNPIVVHFITSQILSID